MQYSRCGNYRRALQSTQDNSNHTALYMEQEKVIFKITVRGGNISTWYETFKTISRGQQVCSIVRYGGEYHVRDEHDGDIANYSDSSANYSVSPDSVWMKVTGPKVLGEYGGAKGFLCPASHPDAEPVLEEAKELGIQYDKDHAAEEKVNDTH